MTAASGTTCELHAEDFTGIVQAISAPSGRERIIYKMETVERGCVRVTHVSLVPYYYLVLLLCVSSGSQTRTFVFTHIFLLLRGEKNLILRYMFI